MKKIRLGLFGLGRGSAFFNVVKANGGEIVAVCEKHEPRIKAAVNYWGDKLAVYNDFDKFIEHKDLDAVFLCNCFHEHAPYAIKCMEKGIAVLTECTAAGTLAEAVELCRVAEKTGSMYMLSENYPFMLFNQEMRKVYRSGTLGELLFAEGEYNHPSDNPPGAPANNDVTKTLRPYEKHWRNYLPRTYYLTHSLAPLMWATGKMPRKVTAMPIYKPHLSGSLHSGDVGAIMLVTNDDNSVFRVTGNVAFGFREDSYRICGTKGQIENVRGGQGKVMLNYTKWAVPEGMEESNYYMPQHETEADKLEAEKAGHGGGDYYVIKEFFRCIRENERPEMDVYFATTMAMVGILGFRSILENKPFDIPDMKDEQQRKMYENDRETPFWGTDGSAPTITCSSNPEFKQRQEVIDRYMEAITTPWSDGTPYVHMG